jgi:hypothetical protein
VSDLPGRGRMHRRCVGWEVAHVYVPSHATGEGGIETPPRGCRAVDRALVQSLAWQLVAAVATTRRGFQLQSCRQGGPRRGPTTSLWFLGPLLGPLSGPRSHDLLRRRSLVTRRWLARRQASACWRYPLRPRACGGVQGRRRRRAMRAKPWTPTHGRGTSSGRSCRTIRPPRCSWTNLKLTSMPISIDADKRRHLANLARNFEHLHGMTRVIVVSPTEARIAGDSQSAAHTISVAILPLSGSDRRREFRQRFAIQS